MAQTTIDAKTGSNGVRSAVDTWATARSATTGTVTNWVMSTLNAGNYQIGRVFVNFDVSTIPSGSTITGVTFVHPAISNNTNNNGITIYVVDHTGADPTVADDYNNIDLNSDTTYGSVAMSGLSTGGATNIVLDASGIAVVQTALDGSALAKFCLRTSPDTANSAPAGVNEYSITVVNSDLIVDYTTPITGGNPMFFSGGITVG